MKPKELKTWMDQHGLNATDVASRVGVSVRTVDRFLKGETIPIQLVMKSLENEVKKGVPNDHQEDQKAAYSKRIIAKPGSP